MTTTPPKAPLPGDVVAWLGTHSGRWWENPLAKAACRSVGYKPETFRLANGQLVRVRMRG